jgi:hypothetical protein
MWTTLGTNVLPSELKDVVKRLGYTGVVGKLGGEWFKRYLKLTGFVMAYNFLITLAKDSVTPGAEYKGPIQALIIRMINAFEFPSIKWTTPAWIVLPEVLELLNNSLIGVPYESFIEKLQNKYNEYLQLWSNAKEKISKKSIVNKVKYDNTIDGLIKWMKEVKKLNLSNSDLPYVKSIGNNIYTYEDADNKVYKYEYTGTTFKDKLK